MNFFGRILKNKNPLIFSSFFLFLLFCLPLVASAEGFDILGTLGSVIGGTGRDMANGLLGAIIALLNSITLVILNLSLGFLNWTASGDFIQGTIMENPMVTVGWTATRNIANVLLIFGLIAVAISIMLEYEENKAKKMLVNFVWIALLINFTPVICNTIIDAANILMGIFLKGGVSQEFVRSIKEAQSASSLEDIPNSFFLLLFSIVAAGIYVLYGLLFIFRYITLWILVIISPIAFATKVFLPTKAVNFLKYILPAQCEWDTWWKEFLNWTFIGVPAAFSIYLSNILMQSIAANQTSVTSAPSGDLSTSVFSYIFSLLIPLGVLVEGFIMTMSKGASFGSFNVGGSIKGLYGKASKKVVGGTYGRAKNTVVGGVVGGYAGAKEGWANTRADIRQRRESGEDVKWKRSKTLWGALGSGKDQAIEGARKGTDFEKFQSKATKTKEDKKRISKMETDEYNDMQTRSLTDIRNMAKNPSNRYTFSAAIRTLQEKGEDLDPETQALIMSNPDLVMGKAKETVATKSPTLAGQLLNPRDIEGSRTILRTIAEKKKPLDDKTLDFLSKNPDLVDGETRKQLLKAYPNLKNVFNPIPVTANNPIGLNGHSQQILDQANENPADVSTYSAMTSLAALTATAKRKYTDEQYSIAQDTSTKLTGTGPESIAAYQSALPALEQNEKALEKELALVTREFTAIEDELKILKEQSLSKSANDPEKTAIDAKIAQKEGEMKIKIDQKIDRADDLKKQKKIVVEMNNKIVKAEDELRKSTNILNSGYTSTHFNTNDPKKIQIFKDARARFQDASQKIIRLTQQGVPATDPEMVKYRKIVEEYTAQQLLNEKNAILANPNSTPEEIAKAQKDLKVLTDMIAERTKFERNNP